MPWFSLFRKKETGLQAKQLQMLSDQARHINAFFPGTGLCMMVHAEGEFVLLKDPSISQPNEQLLAENVQKFRRSALTVSEAMGESSAPVTHVRGTTQMFSLYDTGDATLAFFTDLAQCPEDLDLAECDEQALALLNELSAMVTQFHAALRET